MFWMIFWLIIAIGCFYYFMFGGKEKLSRHLSNKRSLAQKVETIIKSDLSTKFARATFYIDNNYDHGMCQADWQKYCNERIDPALDKDAPEYAEMVAPIVNAIVVGGDGYLLRRGMENMEHSIERFLPGLNDRISLNYFVEPYKYFENEELAEESRKKEALRKEKFEEQYERDRPIREAREAERKAAEQQRLQEQKARREEKAARFDRHLQERLAAQQARARCSQCVNSGKCSITTQSTPGACGGYRPR